MRPRFYVLTVLLSEFISFGDALPPEFSRRLARAIAIPDLNRD